MRKLFVLVSLAAMIALAPLVQADPVTNESGPDAGFLTALDQAGVAYDSRPVAIAVGRQACELMNQGHPEADVIQSLSASNPGFTIDSATKFATSAVGAYCPQHLGEPTTQPPAPSTSPPMWFWAFFSSLPTPGAA